MANKQVVLLLAGVAVALALALTLQGVTAVGSTRTTAHAVPLRGATAARVELALDSGELRLGRGDDRLLHAAFTFNVGAWEPEIDYRVVSREGVLHVEQGESGGPFPVVYGDAVNVWHMALTPEVPLDLRVDLGSADGTLTLGDLDLIGLDVAGDGGDLHVDLAGPRSRDLDVRLSTGGGDLDLALPPDAGVRVVVASDGGAIGASDLQATGTAYVNDRYGTAPLTLNVTVDSDGGDVTLRQAPPPSPEPSPIVDPGR